MNSSVADAKANDNDNDDDESEGDRGGGREIKGKQIWTGTLNNKEKEKKRESSRWKEAAKFLVEQAKTKNIRIFGSGSSRIFVPTADQLDRRQLYFLPYLLSHF